MANIKSMEVDCLAGCNLDSAMKELRSIQSKYNADEVWCIFNTHRIDTNMTTDEVYLKVVGKTKAELDKSQRLWREEYDVKEAEYKESIPDLTKSYIERARGVIPEDKIDVWDKIVPFRLEDLYHGFELDCTLKLVKMLDIDNCTLEEAKKEIEDQGHSGMSYGLQKSMMREFCKRGDEFLEFIK